MVDYELAKQLKDAGFPQYPSNSELPDHHHPSQHFKEGDVEKNYTYFPKLSDLIDACGDRFLGIHRIDSHTWTASEGLWVNGEMGVHMDVTSSTPEKAVANLWLALNKK